MLSRIEKIYSRMCDDTSKRIFLKRLDYSVSGNSDYIEEMLNVSVRKSKEWREFLRHINEIDGQKVVLFGNGIWGKALQNELKGHIDLDGIIDNSVNNDQNVINAKDFFSNYSGQKILISSYKNRESMIGQCLEAGAKDSDIIDVATVMYNLTEGKIYFDDDIPFGLNNGLFIDGGCYDGSDTARYFEEYDGKVLCFEPDVKNAEKIINRLSSYDSDRYRIVSKGLWSKSGFVSFSNDGSRGSRIEQTQNSGGGTIETGTIDEEASLETVSMIKMDIEGAEVEALTGSQNVIKRDRPVLAISIYHKPNDIIDIPECILSICDEYDLYLRHYSFSWYDTVLYAIPKENS